MKSKRFISICIAVVAYLILPVAVDGAGRGGDRGGGSLGRGGDRGGGRGDFDRGGGGNFSRNVSMSRPQVPMRNNYSSAPQRQFSQQAGQPSFQQASQGRSQILSPSEARLSQRNLAAPSNQQLGQSHQQVQQFMQNSNVGQRAASDLNPSANRLNQDASLNNIRQSLPSTLNGQALTANGVRQRLGNRDQGWFNNSFWNNHDYNPGYWNGYGNWWGAASWGDLNGYLGYDWSDPIYYQDGYPIDVNSTDGTNYLLSQPSQYPQNAAVISGNQGGGTAAQQGSNWMPLGVFALVYNVSDAAAPNMVFQLALAKDGALTGSYYNTSSDQVYPVDGLVDRNTQMAAWKMSVGEGAPIFQTGIFNLTKDQTSVNVTYSDGSEQTWLLIRLTPPEGSQETA